MKEIWLKDKKLAEKYSLHSFSEREDEIFEVSKFEDLAKLEEHKGKRIFVRCKNWKVIPLENLIALKKEKKVIGEAADFEEAKLILETLEKGADGVLFEGSEEDLNRLLDYLKGQHSLKMQHAKVTEIRKIGLGARTCLDTADIMNENEGMLSGNSSSGFLLVQAEVTENPHVATRPFRVNAGAISLYTLLANEKTKYLSEVEAGDEILIVDKKGSARRGVIVRNKIEWRPLLLITAKTESEKIVKSILQDAETIRVMTPEGSKSVSELKKGDEILVYVDEGGARHFGIKVDEKIIEK